jgi:hypothetical protein
MRGKVPNPACKTEDLNRIPDDDRSAVIAALEKLASTLREAVKHCQDKQKAVDHLIYAFGDRVPNRPDLVTISVAATVLSHPKKVVAAPEVGRSKSG